MQAAVGERQDLRFGRITSEARHDAPTNTPAVAVGLRACRRGGAVRVVAAARVRGAQCPVRWALHLVDDFYFDRQWAVFEAGMRTVWPEARIDPLTVSHPVFHSFFSIKTLEGMTHPATPAAKAVYLGIHEDNDPAKRLQVVINFNNDIGDYMEWSGERWYPVNLSNDAYKFATNYVVYGLTH
ncbi:MAG: DUF4159 domain-containing protein [Gemmatimonas sp.]|nr:DUF4159 domain-containing protein [Gemmatimonas sp.]